MTQYQIRNRKTDETFTVEADSYQAAAVRAARRINANHGAKIGVVRQSGETEKSGIFQGTVSLSGGEVSSTIGPQFSVT